MEAGPLEWWLKHEGKYRGGETFLGVGGHWPTDKSVEGRTEVRNKTATQPSLTWPPTEKEKHTPHVSLAHQSLLDFVCSSSVVGQQWAGVPVQATQCWGRPWGLGARSRQARGCIWPPGLRFPTPKIYKCLAYLAYTYPAMLATEAPRKHQFSPSGDTAHKKWAALSPANASKPVCPSNWLKEEDWVDLWVLGIILFWKHSYVTLKKNLHL